MKITLAAWCPQNLENSPSPGKSTRVTKFQAIAANQDKANPNAAVFNGGEVQAYVELQNLVPGVADQIKAGGKFIITIESTD